MSEKQQIELELDEEIVELLSQDGIDADLIVNGLIELQRAEDKFNGGGDDSA